MLKMVYRYKKELSYFNIILIETIFSKTLKENKYQISIKENNLKTILFHCLIFFLLKMKFFL